ncbi:MAG: hypothetical protein KY393_01415, partial [Actinobacteria bacterium]|nr:hypothetical protein [Actinomycetota bacterium]
MVRSTVDETIHYSLGLTSLGKVLTAWSRRGVCAVMLGEDSLDLEAELRSRFRSGELIKTIPPRSQALNWVTQLIDAPASGQAPTSAVDPSSAAVEQEKLKLRIRRAAQRTVDAEERPPAEIPEVLTLADRLARPLPSAVWRLDGWQPTDSRVV